MLLPDLVAKVRSGVLHIQFIRGADVVASGSGFVSAGHLVTCHHVFMGPSDCTVSIAWQPDQDPASRQHFDLTRADFQAALVSGSSENALDFAILDVPALRSANLYDFTLEDPEKHRIGEPVGVLGFPLEHTNLTCHQGIISSFFRSGTASVVQLDASINQSNSGGPLLDPSSGRVMGVITRKGTGLSRLFDQLTAVFGQNIEALQQTKGIMRIGGLDPVDVFIAGQNQMMALAHEIERSANVGIGYAFSAAHLLTEEPFASQAALRPGPLSD